jgi:hypothetical protein
LFLNKLRQKLVCSAAAAKLDFTAIADGPKKRGDGVSTVPAFSPLERCENM